MDPTNTLYHANIIASNGLSGVENSNQSVSPVLLNNNAAPNLDVLSPTSFMAQLDVTSPRDVTGLMPNTSTAPPTRFPSVGSNGIVGDRIMRSVLVSGGAQYLDESSLLSSLTYYGDIEEITKSDQENAFIVTFTKVEMARSLLSRPPHGTPSTENMRVQPLASALSTSPNQVIGVVSELPHDSNISVVSSTVPNRFPSSRVPTAAMAKDGAHVASIRGGAQLGTAPRNIYATRRSGSGNGQMVAGVPPVVNPRHSKGDNSSNPRYGAANMSIYHEQYPSQMAPTAVSGSAPIHNSWGMNTIGISGAGNQQRVGSANQDVSSAPYLSTHPYAAASPHPSMAFAGPGNNLNGPPAPGTGSKVSSSHPRSALGPSYLPQSSGLAPSPLYLSHPLSQDNPHLNPLAPFLGPPLSGSGYPLPLRENYPKRILISSNLVGAVIGRGGETIREITTSTGARVDVKREVVGWCQYTGGSATTPAPGAYTVSSGKDGDRTSQSSHNVAVVTPPESQIVFICGPATSTSLAVRRIMEICLKEAQAAGQNEKPHLGLLCEDRFCGRIIGREGKNLNGIREETGASVYVSNTPIVTQLMPLPQQFFTLDRIIDIKGTLDAICQAEQLISNKLHQCQRQDLQRYQQHGNVSSIMPYHSYVGPPPQTNADLVGACGLGQHGSPNPGQPRMFPALSHPSNQSGHPPSFGVPGDPSTAHNIPPKHWSGSTFQHRSMPPNYMLYSGPAGIGASPHSAGYPYSNFLPPAPALGGGFYGPSMHIPPLHTSAGGHPYAFGYGMHPSVYPLGNAANSGYNTLWPSLTPAMLQSALGTEVEMDDALYMRIPHISAGAVIGAEGATINKIMDDTKTIVSVSKVDLQQQRSNRKDVTVTASGDAVEPVEDANTEKSGKVKQSSNSTNSFQINTLQRKVTIRGNPHNQMLAQWHIFQKVKNSSRLGSESNVSDPMNSALDNDLCLWTIIRVPRVLVGRLIGKGGRTVFSIQSTTGTIINLPKETVTVTKTLPPSVDTQKSTTEDSEAAKVTTVSKENNEEAQRDDALVPAEVVNGATPVAQSKPAATDSTASIMQSHQDDSLYQAVEIYGTFENTQHALSRIRSLLNQVIFQLCQQGQSLLRQGGHMRHHSPHTNATSVPQSSSAVQPESSSLSHITSPDDTPQPDLCDNNSHSAISVPSNDSPNATNQGEDTIHTDNLSVNNEIFQQSDSPSASITEQSADTSGLNIEERVNASMSQPVEPSATVE